VKSKSSGDIVDVEEGEAEWLLNALEELFDYCYVAPPQATARRAALNQKLARTHLINGGEHRGRRGARLARRDDREYRQY
jgi:hypothetical protein